MRNLKPAHICVFLGILGLSACNDSDKKTVNTAPTTSDVVINTQTEVDIIDMLVAYDADGDALVYSLTNEPNLGTVQINSDGSYTYTPNKEVTGSDSFMFGVSDGVNDQVTVTVNITIDALQVDFAQFATEAFNQSPQAEPLSVNGRIFTNTDTTIDGLISPNGN